MKRVLPLLFAGGALLFAGCGSSGSGSSSSTAATSVTTAAAAASSVTPSKLVNVKYQNIAISPANVDVKVGTTIRWTNDDMIEHNVTTQSGPVSFHSSNFGQGGTFEYTASTPGVIHYLCTIHPTSMIGTITVVK